MNYLDDRNEEITSLQKQLAKELEKPEAVAKLRNYKEALDRATVATTQFSDEMSKLPKGAAQAVSQLHGALDKSDFENVRKKPQRPKLHLTHNPRTADIKNLWAFIDAEKPKLRATKLAIAIRAVMMYFPADQFKTKKVRK